MSVFEFPNIALSKKAKKVWKTQKVFIIRGRFIGKLKMAM